MVKFTVRFFFLWGGGVGGRDSYANFNLNIDSLLLKNGPWKCILRTQFQLHCFIAFKRKIIEYRGSTNNH